MNGIQLGEPITPRTAAGLAAVYQYLLGGPMPPTVATCKECGSQNVRAERATDNHAAYWFACAGCGATTEPHEYAKDCHDDVDWQPRREARSA